MNIYTLQNDVNNDYRMGSRERMREEQESKERGRERERERERGRDKKTRKQKNVEMLMSTRRVSCPPCAPPFHSTSNCS